VIGAYGGLSIDQSGNRSYPGSGGYIGGLEIAPGLGNAYIGGAGPTYETFTPGPQAAQPSIQQQKKFCFGCAAVIVIAIYFAVRKGWL
jgi:hypothetical protein